MTLTALLYRLQTMAAYLLVNRDARGETLRRSIGELRRSIGTAPLGAAHDRAEILYSVYSDYLIARLVA